VSDSPRTTGTELRRILQVCLVVALIGISAACTRARANTEPVMPELIPPTPPPRVVERMPDDPVPTIEPSPVDSALATPAKPPTRPIVKPELPKPEPEPVRAEPERPANVTPPLTLKPAPGVAAQTEASIRGLLDGAHRNLQRVPYASLNADGRAQYDTARRFMAQADEALKANNLAFAGKLADKAATMASILVR
jgi:type IV secretory pathway VirB10-like protein